MDIAARIFGSLIAGALFGLIPGVIGYKKGKKGLAAAGFVSCVIGSFLMGIFLSIPACIIFTVIIVIGKDNQAITNNSYGSQNIYSSDLRKCVQCGNPINSNEKFCNICGASQTTNQSQFFCPYCGNKVEDGILFCNQCGAKVR